MAPFPGGKAAPGRFIPGEASFDIQIDNSAVQGILSFGGFPFPMAAVCQTPNLQIRTRGDGGDAIEDSTPTVVSAGLGVNVFRVSGTNFDLGGSGYVTDGLPLSITSFCSHGRWVANAGVARTVQRTTQINILDITNTVIVEVFQFDITATFTG